MSYRLRPRFFELAVAVAAVFLNCSVLFAAPESAAKMKIGVILPLSGPAASLGRYLKNGIELGYDALPAETKSKVELFFEDDQLQSANAVSAFQRLRTEKGIQAAFVLGSGIGNALAPLAEKAGVILVAIGASDGNVARGRKYAFVHWVTPEVEAKVLADEFVRRNYRRIAIVSTEQEGAQAILDAVHKALDEQKLSDRVLEQKIFLPGETDFRTYIAKLKAGKADCVLILLFPGPLASFAKQSQALHLGADLAGIELFEDEHEVQAADGALIGQWYVNADVATDELVQRYEKKYGEHPGWGVANAFDTLTLVASAAAQFGPDTEKIATFLSTLRNYSGAAGVYSATGDNRFVLPATVKVVTKDGFAKLRP